MRLFPQVLIQTNFFFVSVSDSQNCSSSALNASSGYIHASSVLTSLSTGPGSVACPWRVTALPGQQIQLQIVDVSLSVALKDHNYADECPLTLVVLETIGANEKRRDQALCGGVSRVRQVLTSSSHSIDFYLQVVSSEWLTEEEATPSFMLHYAGEMRRSSIKCNRTTQ